MNLTELIQHNQKTGGFREMGSVVCFCEGCRDPVVAYHVFRQDWPFVAHFCLIHQRVFSKMFAYGLAEQDAHESATNCMAPVVRGAGYRLEEVTSD